MLLRKKVWTAGAVVAVSALGLAACGTTSGEVTPSGSTTPVSSSSNTPVQGAKVEIVGDFGGVHAEGFQAELDAWGATSGVEATYTQLQDFSTTIVARVAGGDAPDIAIFPQPGVLMGLSSNMIPLDDLVDVPAITDTLVPGWDTLATNGDVLYGLPIGANVKSLVWYNPAAFEAANLAVPTTDAELTALTATIRDEGLGYPWCVGIESGAATGWPATDWLEEYVLRYGGIDTYNKWWRHEIPFNDPIVVQAAEKFAELALTEGNVNGGGQAIALEGFGTAGNGLFIEGGKDAGQCFMMRQGSFITDFFPEDIQAEYVAGDYTHVGVFPLPTPEGANDAVLGGGDFAAAFSNNEAVKQTLSYILSDQLGTNGWAASGFFLSPHKTFSPTLYPTTIQQQIGEQLSSADTFGFDASDLMPGAVGSGTAWTNLTEWIAGQKSLEDALQTVEDNWPADS